MSKRTIAIINGNTRVNAEGYHELASLTKQLFAYAVVKLALEGKWELDCPLSECAPGVFISSDERAKTITSVHILTHTAGFDNWEHVEDKSVRFTPGTAYRYSGEGYHYLEQCINAKNGGSLQALIDTYINGPLGTHIASCYQNIPAGSEVITPCTGGAYEPKMNENAAYSAYATASDMHAFYTMMLSDAAFMRVATSRRIAISDGVEWCMGFGLIFGRFAFQYGDNGDSQGLFLGDIAGDASLSRVSLRLANERYGLMDAVNAIENAALRERLTAFLKREYGEEFEGLARG